MSDLATSTNAAEGAAKLPVTAFVVTYNEARRLRDCLRSLAFCDQVIVIDLGSSDDSAEIAAECGAEVHRHERMPIADMILPRMQHLARNAWRMRFDPDEVLDPGLLPEVARLMTETTTGIIRLSYQYFFKDEPLRTTVWGGVRHMTVFFHRHRTQLQPLVHQGIVCAPGFGSVCADAKGMYPVRHYWVDGYGQLLEKHLRYLGKEGESRHAAGARFGWFSAVRATAKALGVGLIKTSGWRGGVTGWGLSLFYGWYEGMAQLALRRHERLLSAAGRKR